jgi:DNA-binding response OmpR family regulator
MKILLIEDDDVSITLLTKNLSAQNHIVDAVRDGEMGWTYASTFDYNLIILNAELSKLDGISLCKRVRLEGYTIPILLIVDSAGKSAEQNRDLPTAKIQGLDAGADDCVVKPFNINELSARVRALLRRSSANPLPLLSWGDLVLNPSTCDVSYNGQSLILTTKEYDLLELFLRDSHHVFSSDEIIDRLWSSDDFPVEATVRSHLRRLRHKLQVAGAPADFIGTIHGRGYYLKSSVSLPMDVRVPRNSTAELHQPGAPTTVRGVSVMSPEAPIASSSESSQPIAFSTSALLLVDLKPDLDAEITSLSRQYSCQVSSLSSGCVVNPINTTVDNYLTNIPAASVFLPTVVLVNLMTGSAVADCLDLVQNIDRRFPHWSIVVLSNEDDLGCRLAAAQNGAKFLCCRDLTPIEIFYAAMSLGKSATDKITVTIVDDDVDWLKTLPPLLQNWEIKATTLADPDELLTFVRLLQPDIVILDIQMPQINGLELCQILRGDPHWQHLPVILLSGIDREEIRRQAFGVGADDYLCKPLNVNELAHRIRHRYTRVNSRKLDL